MKKIFMIGDSTMQFNNAYSYPPTGWGQVLPIFTKPEYQIIDLAKNGRSTKSFIDEGRFKEIEEHLQKGDFIICQFGHNDEKDDPLRHTDPNGSYLENLAYFAAPAKEKGAHIVFATSISRRSFKNGVCQDTHKGYPQAMKKWCEENNYTCIDLNTLTLNLYNELGEEATKKFHVIFPANTYTNYPEGKTDNSHLLYEGAHMVSELFVSALAKTNDPLKNCFLDLDNKEEIDWKMLID